MNLALCLFLIFLYSVSFTLTFQWDYLARLGAYSGVKGALGWIVFLLRLSLLDKWVHHLNH